MHKKSPPGPDGLLHPLVLAAAALCEVDEIYAMGGAQAIFALAYGTATVPKVDVIAGPGNSWVMEAKRRVYGRVGIDSLAGPSELMVIAGRRNRKFDAIGALSEPTKMFAWTRSSDVVGRISEPLYKGPPTVKSSPLEGDAE